MMSLSGADESESFESIEEITVISTRNRLSFEQQPTRIELLGSEEVNEKANMKPGDIRMLLNEITGIHVQQTSPVTFNSSIRIQGLDGKYTQLLLDGMPLYGGLSAGLGLLQIPPLDLEQVEVIKGANSTLYGGGAIAGLVNLISKKPRNESKTSVMLNKTSAGGMDLSSFHASKKVASHLQYLFLTTKIMHMVQMRVASVQYQNSIDGLSTPNCLSKHLELS